MQDYLNKIVVIGHPNCYDRHIIAKVVKQTKATVVVRYWKHLREMWDDEENTRRLTHSKIITTILGSEIPDHKVKIMSERLTSAQSEMNLRVKEAKTNYHQFVMEIKCP